MVEEDAILSKAKDVASKPFCSMGADLVEDVGVNHGCFGEESFRRRGKIREIAVEEDFEDFFGNPREHSFPAQDIAGEQSVDYGIARYYPFL